MPSLEFYLMTRQTGRHSPERTALSDEELIEFKDRLKDDVMLLGKVCGRSALNLFTQEHGGDNQPESVLDSYRDKPEGFAGLVATKAAIIAARVQEGIELPDAEWPEGILLPDELYGLMKEIMAETGSHNG